MTILRLFFVAFFAISVTSSRASADVVVHVVEFAILGDEVNPETIASALNNGTIDGAVRRVAEVKDDAFFIDDRTDLRAVKEVDTDGTVTEWSQHKTGTRCHGAAHKTDAQSFYKISGDYEYSAVIGYRLFKLADGNDSAVGQPLFRTMRKHFDIVLEIGEWYVFTSVPKAGSGPSSSSGSLHSAAQSATTRVMALQLTEK